MASAITSTARAIIFYLKPLQQPPHPRLLSPRHLIALPTTTTTSLSARRRTFSSPTTFVCCLVSGVDGGGVYDTRKSEFSREFAVIANMLKRIEPLDTSDISQGVSDSAKDSMKQTISTMLGLLPSDQFSVSVRVSKVPLLRLLVSSIITGYTLWNAEYRISLMRNFELPLHSSEDNCSEDIEVLKPNCEDRDCGDRDVCAGERVGGLDQNNSHSLKGLSSEAMSYIQKLEAELDNAKNELDVRKQEYMQMESNRRDDNNLLEYLRSLEFDMVSELSQPSSLEVKEVVHQLVQNILQRFFKGDHISELEEDRAIGTMEDHQDGAKECSQTISTSRDYLAKLLFWCMLLGHHLRGLENRLHLSCVVGLL
ncbi:hypothetical protein Nepgr_006122 [Nepenthes gracilis]|uniref:Seed maturation-like protein n=1 Tax=Nepenthes gracilis TaxID=150966 RepID=A0AAD3S4I9_NEPGR|nr:hypothetical protein Nepgr_006122 [Nepenthes gracilis]